ncbi:MAG: tRNA (adenosine(37)-N6)-threonylcarbamoyltransferase complex transferase subunit TsaD [Candidatus Atribacteria bacterium]|nr:tRNA (adenosine(37)-N6)-threonylcarbamoyltransferase complex transferase subunit TsaD [Candidatus Atribacteria bacterium]MCD6349167.1 tRNA (adenosine(37)-N6)-threonylcarbamoyltransferase complex transferase subunit TsaD [Candidatus Atribacteria bacterium]
MYILGIETSCDDTCCAVLKNGNQVLSNVVSSQVDFHRKYGGVVPEIASRKHLELLPYVTQEALLQAKIGLEEINLIAVTIGPGLMGSLLMGTCWAKALALCFNLPIIGVNHIEGHLFAAYLEHQDLTPPFVALIASGGHTELIAVKEWGNYHLLGRTRDDAAGEAFDKIARFLGLGYPGGPVIDELSKEGNPSRFSFKAGFENENSFEFSFSGLKTAVIRTYQGLKLEPEDTKDLVASFQESVVRVLTKKTILAAKKLKVQKIAIGGGVAANRALREKLKEEAQKEGLELYLPSKKFCTDNAAMIAACGHFHFIQKPQNYFSIKTLEPDPKLSIT